MGADVWPRADQREKALAMERKAGVFFMARPFRWFRHGGAPLPTPSSSRPRIPEGEGSGRLPRTAAGARRRQRTRKEPPRRSMADAGAVMIAAASRTSKKG